MVVQDIPCLHCRIRQKIIVDHQVAVLLLYGLRCDRDIAQVMVAALVVRAAYGDLPGRLFQRFLL